MVWHGIIWASMALYSVQTYMFFICSQLSSRDIPFSHNGLAEISHFEEKSARWPVSRVLSLENSRRRPFI